MTYQTKLWRFYWERLGYENQHLPTKCKDALGGSSGDPPTEYGKVSRTNRQADHQQKVQEIKTHWVKASQVDVMV